MNTYPKDCNARKICSKARAIFPNRLNLDNWEFHEMTGTDHGTDMIIEYIENNEFKSYKIECQIKGTANIEKYKTKENISYPLDVKTINYALNCKNAFILVLVDIINEEVYYITIQDYFIANRRHFESLNKNTSTINIHIFENDKLTKENDNDLREVAKCTYKRAKEDEIIKI
jgi:hypothetical protein